MRAFGIVRSVLCMPGGGAPGGGGGSACHAAKGRCCMSTMLRPRASESAST